MIEIANSNERQERIIRRWLAEYPRKPRKLRIRVVEGLWACHSSGWNALPCITIGTHPDTFRPEVFWHELDHHFGWHYSTPSPWNPASHPK